MSRLAEVHAKLNWAEGHLVKLDRLVGEFVSLHAYDAVATTQGKKKRTVWRLQFTTEPDTQLALVIGDFLYNVRAALDYLAASLVPSSERSHVMFPVMSEAVWDIPFAKGENPQRTEARQKWETIVRKMPAQAVEILKDVQPITEKANHPNFHVRGMLNRLANKDRHCQLHVVAWGLTDVDVDAYPADGTRLDPGNDNLDERSGVRDGGRIQVPKEVVKMAIRGTPIVAIGSNDDRLIRIPDHLWACLALARDKILGPVAPYVRP